MSSEGILLPCSASCALSRRMALEYRCSSPVHQGRRTRLNHQVQSACSQAKPISGYLTTPETLAAFPLGMSASPLHLHSRHGVVTAASPAQLLLLPPPSHEARM